MQVKQQILALLMQVEELLLEAQCEGKQFAELDCFEEADLAVAHLTQVVDYYVD